jgi:hypothetical protein
VSTTTAVSAYHLLAEAVPSEQIRVLLQASSSWNTIDSTPLIVRVTVPAGGGDWRTPADDGTPDGCTATLEPVTPTVGELVRYEQWKQSEALGVPQTRDPLSRDIRGEVALALFRTDPFPMQVTSEGHRAVIVDVASRLAVAVDVSSPAKLMSDAVAMRIVPGRDCFASNRPAPRPASPNATMFQIFDVAPRLPPEPLSPGVTATGTVTSALSAAAGSAATSTVVARSSLVSSLLTCEATLADELSVDANPTRVSLGSSNVRSHFGAVVMNSVLLLVCALVQFAAAAMRRHQARVRLGQAGDNGLARLADLLERIAMGQGDLEGLRIGLPLSSRPNSQPGHGRVRALRGHVQSRREKDEILQTWYGALRWARFPSLLAFPLLFLYQPIVTSGTVLLVYADNPLVQTVGAVVLLGAVAIIGFVFWRFHHAPFPATFVKPSVVEKMALDKRWDDIVKHETAGALSGAALRHQVSRFFRSRGDWRDATSGSWFVRANFLFIADYTPRCRWMLLVELVFSGLLGIVGALVAAGKCDGTNWVTLVLFTGYLATLLYKRGFESRFNFAFAVFIGLVQWVSAVLAICGTYDSTAALAESASILIAVAMYTTTLRAANDVLRVTVRLLQRRGRMLLSFQVQRLDNLRNTNWGALLGQNEPLPPKDIADAARLIATVLQPRDWVMMALRADGDEWITDSAEEATRVHLALCAETADHLGPEITGELSNSNLPNPATEDLSSTLLLTTPGDELPTQQRVREPLDIRDGYRLLKEIHAAARDRAEHGERERETHDARRRPSLPRTIRSAQRRAQVNLDNDLFVDPAAPHAAPLRREWDRYLDDL